MSISITYNTSTESNVTQEFNTANELKTFISNNKAIFTGAMKVVCDNSITNCINMFRDCVNITSIDLSEFNTSNVIRMDSMFENCTNLISLNVNNFNTDKVINMQNMFFNCFNLISLDVSNFNIKNIKYINGIFQSCSNLTTIYCEQDWNNDTITSSTNMFNNCSKLKGAIPYDSTKTDINYANPTTGYFTKIPSRKFLVNLNMDQNEIKNMLLDKRNTAPNSPAAGQIYYNTTDKKIYIYNGTEWIAGSGFESSLKLVEAQPYESPEVI